MRKDPEIEQYWQNLHRSSLTTPDNYCRRLNLFCNKAGISWHALAEMPETESFRIRCDFTTELEKYRDEKNRPYSDRYVSSVVNVTPCNWIEFKTGRRDRYVKVTKRGIKKSEFVTPDQRKVEQVWATLLRSPRRIRERLETLIPKDVA